MPFFPDTPDTPDLYEEQNVFTGGFIDVSDSRLLAPHQVAFLLNVRPDVSGQGVKRRGVVPLGVPDSTASDTPRGLTEMRVDLEGVNLLFAQYGSKLFSTPGNGVFTRRASSVSLYDTSYAAVQGARRLYFASAAPHTNVSLPHGTLLAIGSDFSFTEVSTVRPRALAWFQGRLWAFNTALSASDMLAWSAVGDGRDFSNGQTVQIDRGAQDVGTGIVPLRGAESRLVLFKEHSIHELSPYWTTDGFVPATANTLDFTKSFLRALSYGTGCLATRSIVTVPGQGQETGDVLFFSNDGFRALSRSVNDLAAPTGLPLSFPIDQTIRRINLNPFVVSKIAGAYWQNIVYWAVPVDGATENNLVIAYDLVRQAWFLYDWNVAGWASARLGTNRKFYFLPSTTFSDYGFGTSTPTLGPHLYETDTGTLDPGRRPITLDIQTRAFSFANAQDPAPGLKWQKRWNYLDFGLRAAATNASILIQYKLDDFEDWVDLRTVYLDPVNQYPILSTPLPFSFRGTKFFRERISLHEIPPGYRLQLRFTDTTSFARVVIQQFYLRARPRNVRLAR